MQGFNFQHPIQVRWNDMDALGHVNNAGMYPILKLPVEPLSTRLYHNGTGPETSF